MMKVVQPNLYSYQYKPSFNGMHFASKPQRLRPVIKEASRPSSNDITRTFLKNFGVSIENLFYSAWISLGFGDLSETQYDILYDKFWDYKSITKKDLYRIAKSGCIELADCYGKTSIEELSQEEKLTVVQNLLKTDVESLKLHKGIADKLALLPKTEEENEELIQKIFKALNLSPKKYGEEEIVAFNQSLHKLLNSISKKSDNELNTIDINIENGKFKSKDKLIEKLLNEIAIYIPQLLDENNKEEIVSKKIKYSLGIINGFAQSDNFKKLPESDKKVLILTALMQDIVEEKKYDYNKDSMYSTNSSFIAFYNAQNLGLSDEEQRKLVTLVSIANWPRHIANTIFKQEREFRLQEVALNLLYENLLEMSLIYTTSQIAFINDDEELMKKSGLSKKIRVQGEKQNFIEAYDFFKNELQQKVDMLKKTQPLLPVTKFPSASKIREAITEIKADGRTNIPGVYIDTDGLVVLKYNEIKDWDKIGFSQGTASSGTTIPIYKGDGSYEEVETGNIKFFTHGFEGNVLRQLKEVGKYYSEAILSTSYADRPETKHRFYRAQGAILNSDSIDILGGGARDKGSGYKKNMSKFRQISRDYVSKLLENILGVSSDEYSKLASQYANKELTEINLIELRRNLIKAYGAINSNPRKGNRNYSEFFLRYPYIMGYYVYSVDGAEKINNPLDFLKRNYVTEEEQYAFDGLQDELQPVATRISAIRKDAVENNKILVLLGG